jgi:hypothetical protein
MQHCRAPSTHCYVVAPLQRVNRRAPSTRCLTRPFNAMSARPFNTLLCCRAPSTRHYVITPLQCVVRCTPSTRRSTHPFNASLNAPIQRVGRHTPSTHCSMRPFNASFDAPLQLGVQRAPSTRHRRAHSTRLRRAPSTRCLTRPFNTHHLCALHGDVVAPFNALSLHAFPRVLLHVSATRLCARYSTHCWRTLSRYVDAPFYCVAVE